MSLVRYRQMRNLCAIAQRAQNDEGGTDGAKDKIDENHEHCHLKRRIAKALHIRADGVKRLANALYAGYQRNAQGKGRIETVDDYDW